MALEERGLFRLCDNPLQDHALLAADQLYRRHRHRNLGAHGIETPPVRMDLPREGGEAAQPFAEETRRRVETDQRLNQS